MPPAADPPQVPGRPRLLPGVHVVRRDAEHLQVGLDRRRATVLPDVPAVRAVLGALRDEAASAPGGTPDGDTRWVHHRLDRAGLLVDGTVLARDRDRHGPSLATGVHARHGAAASARLAGRARARVEVVATGAPAGRADPAAELAAALAEQGLRVRTHPGAESAVGAPAHDARVVVVVGRTSLRRAEVDPVVRAGVPHLVLAADGTDVRVGPFVVPGTTACLRCLDAHETADDPRWALVREQVAAGDRHPPGSTLDWRAATALAAADVLRWVEGDVPLLWSATVVLGVHAALAPRTWERHPWCGCTWDDLGPPAG